MPRGLQVILAFLAAASAGYITYMLAQFLPLFIRLTTVEIGLGPRSLNAVFRWGYSFYAAWPYVAQDLGILLMIVAAFRLMGVLKAAAIACGLVLVLAYSFLTMINFICAVLILALAAIDDAASLRHSRWLVLAAFILVLPPMLLTDEAGLSTGLVWSAIMAAVALVTIQAVQPAADQARAVRRPQTLATSTVLAVALLLLVASARGTLVLSSGWPGGTDLSPRVRDIWQAVRERVPADALIFTDQTGRDNGFLGGWNTYVLNGQRQVYISSWYESYQLRIDPAARDARLQVNDEVLSGQLDPAQVKTSRQYGSFFAVVSAQRRPLPRWQPVYANQDYALYRWNP
jgi:hypothetical protein